MGENNSINAECVHVEPTCFNSGASGNIVWWRAPSGGDKEEWTIYINMTERMISAQKINKNSYNIPLLSLSEFLVVLELVWSTSYSPVRKQKFNFKAQCTETSWNLDIVGTLFTGHLLPLSCKWMLLIYSTVRCWMLKVTDASSLAGCHTKAHFFSLPDWRL